MAVAQFIASAEGFDIYSSGAIPANYPWYVINSTLQGQINSSGGAFGGGALTFPTSAAGASLATGFEYQFPSTMTPIRGNVSAGGQGAFAVNFWLNVNSMTAGSGTLLGLGTAGTPGIVYPLLNISQSSTTGTNLQFITNLNSPTSSPYNFNIQLNTYYWVQLQFAYYSTSSTASTGTWLATYSINGTVLQSALPLTWSADVFTAGLFANRLKFYCSNFIDYFIDDLVIQAVSNADSTWPVAGGSFPVPTTVPSISARRIYAIPATAAGSVTQWTPSGSEPNWQSATSPTNANFVTATAVAQTDTYKWTCPTAGDIRGVVMRGNSNRYQNVNATFTVNAGSTLAQMNTTDGPSLYIGVAETDGTNAWTTASINAAEFGQTSK